MDVAAWANVPLLIDAWTEKCAEPAADLRRAISDIYATSHVDVFWSPNHEVAAFDLRGDLTKSAQDVAWVRRALSRAVGKDHVLLNPVTYTDIAGGDLVKVAYSPALKRTAEYLNFIPGKYPGGIPNAPSPLAAALTTGVLGAGLGYGLGRAGEYFLPDRYERGKLSRTLALAGGALGAVPGAIGMAANYQTGRGMLDPSGLIPRGEPADQGEVLKQALDMLAPIEVGKSYMRAVNDFCKKAYFGQPPDPHPLKINVNQLGQVLYNTGAPPMTIGQTMSTMYAAQQMPDPSYSGHAYVTPKQIGLFGMAMGAAGGGLAGYATGYAVGKTLGTLVGMPQSDQDVLKRTGLAVGIANAVIPKLFR